MASEDHPVARAIEAPKAKTDEVRPSSSYDALMRLSSLDECIQDALQTREKLTAQIDALLERQRAHRATLSKVGEGGQSLALLRRYLGGARTQLASSTNEQAKTDQSLKARRQAILQGRYAQEKGQDYLNVANSKLMTCKELLRQCIRNLRGQQRRICEDMLRIYPIEPVIACPFRPG